MNLSDRLNKIFLLATFFILSLEQICSYSQRVSTGEKNFKNEPRQLLSKKEKSESLIILYEAMTIDSKILDDQNDIKNIPAISNNWEKIDTSINVTFFKANYSKKMFLFSYDFVDENVFYKFIDSFFVFKIYFFEKDFEVFYFLNKGGKEYDNTFVLIKEKQTYYLLANNLKEEKLFVLKGKEIE